MNYIQCQLLESAKNKVDIVTKNGIQLKKLIKFIRGLVAYGITG